MIDTTPDLALMVVSPIKGTFHRAEAGDAGILRPARPADRRRSPSLRDADRGDRPARRQVVEWLVEDGDLVSPGQPLVRLHPDGSA